jgi:hypothetical protein
MQHTALIHLSSGNIVIGCMVLPIKQAIFHSVLASIKTALARAHWKYVFTMLPLPL